MPFKDFQRVNILTKQGVYNYNIDFENNDDGNESYHVYPENNATVIDQGEGDKDNNNYKLMNIMSSQTIISTPLHSNRTSMTNQGVTKQRMRQNKKQQQS